jgi:LAS superfamily LD-carboxypeptidase LdcB
MTDEFINERVHDYFCTDTLQHIIAITAQHRGHRLGTKVLVSEDQYRRMQTSPEEKEEVLELLRKEIREFATRMNLPEIRRLRAQWTMESQQDIRAMLNEEAARALAAQMAEDLGGLEPGETVNWINEGF